MLEQEIKLYVPPASRAAVKASLAKLPGPRRVRLRAMYFDTPTRWLASHHAALRLRLEGRQWVQTLKMAGDDGVSRIELNHARPSPELDLSVYQGTPAEGVVSLLDGEVILRYETDVMRMTRQIRVRRANIEIAYDVGVVRADGFEAGIDEIEFERTAGWLEAVFAVAADWSREHGLILDARSKAERGDALARAAARVAATDDDGRAAVIEAERARLAAPVGATRLRLDPQIAPAQAMSRISLAAFDQIVRNAALITAAGDGDTAEHVHQLRVGIRRLRAAWRFMRGWAPPPDAAVVDGARTWFGVFGDARDAEVRESGIARELANAGMPPLPARRDETLMSGAAAVTDPAFQAWLLDLLRWVAAAPAGADLIGGLADNGIPAPALRDLAARRLRKWHGQLVRDGEDFLALDDDARHDLRKHAKRLRYALAFVRSLFDNRRTRAYLKRLSALQDILGELNDLAVARGHYLGRAHGEPHAWFAVGYIAARREDLSTRATRALAELAKVKPFWK